jgi:hypothetical protein
MSTEPKVIYSAASIQQAYLLRGLLEEEGIRARVVNDAIQIAGGDLPLGWAAAARVVVPEHQAAQARAIAEDFDRQTALPAIDENRDDPAPTESTADWPACPQCHTPRSAQCPICGTVAANFPLAEFQPETLAERTLFLCRTCDDHMQPHWYRFCAGCNHDFGSGIEPAPPPSAGSGLSTSVIFLLALLIIPSLALGAYFWWLLR